MGSKPPKESKSEGAAATREAILDAVYALCEETSKEAHELTLGAIAARADVSRMTLYRHFANKQALLDSVGEERGVAIASQPAIRERIIAAARDIFVAEGFGATMETIAASAGVGVATLYRHFGDKQSLLESLRESIRPTAEFTALELSPSDDIEADISAFATGIIARLRANRDVFVLAMRERLSPAGDASMLKKSGETVRRLTRYFEGQQKAGRLRDESPEDLAASLMGMILTFAWIYPTLSETPPQPPEIIGPMIARIFVRDLRNHKTHENQETT